MQTIAVTGASGYIGRQLVPLLASQSDVRCVALQRTVGTRTIADRQEVRHFQLLDPLTYPSALAGVDCVVHLAARTGRATAAEMAATNRWAVVQLLKGAEAAGVRRFLFVSTLAVHSPWLSLYPYAQNKALAELAVKASHMDVGVVRLGSVFGPQSPVGSLLTGLGKLPLVPVSCSAMQQPVDVEDVTLALLGLLQLVPWGGQTWEVGGPRVASLASCIVGLSAARGHKGPQFAPLALKPWLTRIGSHPPPWFSPYLGQLAALDTASVADPALRPPGWQPRIGWADLLRRAGLPS
jgi:nucleoside-diphosphate-sugar epimerase